MFENAFVKYWTFIFLDLSLKVFNFKTNMSSNLLPDAVWLMFRKLSKCVVFSFVYFTLDDYYRVNEVFIMLLIRRAIIAHYQ